MVMVLWASPPAGSGMRRKKRGEIGRDDLVTLAIDFLRDYADHLLRTRKYNRR